MGLRSETLKLAGCALSTAVFLLLSVQAQRALEPPWQGWARSVMAMCAAVSWTAAVAVCLLFLADVATKKRA